MNYLIQHVDINNKYRFLSMNNKFTNNIIKARIFSNATKAGEALDSYIEHTGEHNYSLSIRPTSR